AFVLYRLYLAWLKRYAGATRVFGRMAICLPRSFFEPYDGRKSSGSYCGTGTSAPSTYCACPPYSLAAAARAAHSHQILKRGTERNYEKQKKSPSKRIQSR